MTKSLHEINNVLSPIHMVVVSMCHKDGSDRTVLVLTERCQILKEDSMILLTSVYEVSFGPNSNCKAVSAA